MSKTVSSPFPNEAVQTQSAHLFAVITDTIAAAGGWLSFDRYMELAFYTPGLGYYSSGVAKLNRRVEDGDDFITAPELTPFFSRTVTYRLARVLQALPEGQCYVPKSGTGTGRLTVDIFIELDVLSVRPNSCGIVELSGELRQRQQERLAALSPDLGVLAQWHDILPVPFTDVMIGNEVLDVMPMSLWAQCSGI